MEDLPVLNLPVLDLPVPNLPVLNFLSVSSRICPFFMFYLHEIL
jgi:hypothetical protein